MELRFGKVEGTKLGILYHKWIWNKSRDIFGRELNSIKLSKRTDLPLEPNFGLKALGIFLFLLFDLKFILLFRSM